MTTEERIAKLEKELAELKAEIKQEQTEDDMELKPCPFCGSEARIRDLYDVVDWTDDDEPITERRFVCDCSGVECWVSPVTDPFDTEEEAIEAWNRRSEV